MSFVDDHVKALDEHLDQIQLAILDEPFHNTSRESRAISEFQHDATTRECLRAIKRISPPTRSELRNRDLLVGALNSATPATVVSQQNIEDAQASRKARSLEWILLAKVTVQAYGHVLKAFINQIVPLNDEILYWDGVLSSQQHTALYSVQTSPLRFSRWSKQVLQDINDQSGSISQTWRDFYNLVDTTVRKRSIKSIRTRLLGPLAVAKADASQRLEKLDHLKQNSANIIGCVLSECKLNTVLTEIPLASLTSRDTEPHMSQLSTIVGKTVTWLNSALSADSKRTTWPTDSGPRGRGTSHDSSEEVVHFEQRDDEAAVLKAEDVSALLQQLLQSKLPQQLHVSQSTLEENRRPSFLIRYWLPAIVLLFSSSTLLRILLSRRAAIIQWIRDLGATTIDFWVNWIVEPTKRLVGTIRHDESSEVSIMSKRSLEGDRSSLERMVVEFAIQHPEGGSALNETQIADVRAKVGEGDLTPVLRVYESELQSPLYNSVRGNLIRALLIQIQKTKVDVEVAMGGIDNLLKSQELVFGFVGLTPSLLVCFGIYSWFRNTFGKRRLSRQGDTHRQSIQVLRNMDRILTSSNGAREGLSYAELGLFVCEAIILRDLAMKGLPKRTRRDFLADFDALIEPSIGLQQRQRILDRIRWGYSMQS